MTPALIAPAATFAVARPESIGSAFWRSLKSLGKLRDQPHLLDLAASVEALQPNLAKELRSFALRGPMD